ncbi:50S ribosomal protein L11 methyltransferase [bacterium]|nr:50S ribosomal protein L11 methyltransferase [bacterium]
MNKPTFWLEWSIPSSFESFEAIENFLFENGCTGCEEKKGLIKAYFSEHNCTEEFHQHFNTYLMNLTALGLNVGTPTFRIIPTEDWNHRWRSFFKPIQITERMIVKPPWSKLKPSRGQIIIEINPKMAFGTGHHATTQLCLELLECYLKPKENVLDIGTGSGILSIAAAKLGANKVLALDTEENAIENARENIRLNHVENCVEIHHHPVGKLPFQTFNLLVANINRTTLTSLLPKLKRYSDDHSRFILSGILQEERTQMGNDLTANRFQLIELKIRGEWCGMVVQIKSSG